MIAGALEARRGPATATDSRQGNHPWSRVDASGAAARRAGVRFRRQQGDGAAGRGGHAHRVLSSRRLARLGPVEVTRRTAIPSRIGTLGGSKAGPRQSGSQHVCKGGNPTGLSPLLVYQPDSGHRSGLFSPERPAIIEYRYSKTSSPRDHSTSFGIHPNRVLRVLAQGNGKARELPVIREGSGDGHCGEVGDPHQSARRTRTDLKGPCQCDPRRWRDAHRSNSRERTAGRSVKPTTDNGDTTWERSAK